MFQNTLTRRHSIFAILLLLTLALFTTSSLAKSHYRYYQRAESRINAIVSSLYFEKNVKPLCEDCQKAADKYNDIVHKMNIFVRLARSYRKDFLKGARQIANQKNALAKLNRRRSADEDQIQRLETRIAKNVDENNHLAKMAAAHKKNYEKLNRKREAAMSALKTCEYHNCLKLGETPPITSCKECVFFVTNYNTILKGVDSIRNRLSRNEIQEAMLQRDLSRLNHLDSQENKRPYKERSRSRAQQRHAEKRRIKKRLSDLKSDRISLNTALQRELTRLAKAKAVLQKCERDRCPGEEHSYFQPPTNGGANGDHATTNGGFSLGLLGNYAINNREASFTSTLETNANGEQSRTMDGFGFGAIMQYALLAHPALFFYALYSYPGDHSGTALNLLAANLETTLRVFKHYSLAIGVAYTLLHYGQNNLSLGFGFDVVRQSLTAQIRDENSTANINRNITSVAPHLLLQTLIPVMNRHMALMFGLSAALLPNIRMNVNTEGGLESNTNFGQYLFRLHAGIEWTLLFGLMYSF